jgi:hypothetical protein
MDLYTALGPPEFRLRKKRQAEADGTGVEGQQFVPEPELPLAEIQRTYRALTIRKAISSKSSAWQ